MATAAPAGSLYTSGRFRSQLKLARHFAKKTFVLSAKHGVLDIREEIEPYDVTYPNGIFASDKSLQGIQSLQGDFPIVFLGGNRYFEVISRSISSDRLYSPLLHLNTFEAASFSKALNDFADRESQTRVLYDFLEGTARRNGLYEFRRFPDIQKIPHQGVYFVFDPSEPTSYSNTLPRIVRIGTHGVSVGSKSTLRTRLRAHFGQRDGTGNHRASIFRLHVGNALVNKLGARKNFPDWGVGMSAPPDIRVAEREMESCVSEYIGSLLFTFLDVEDLSSPQSGRAVIERSVINLLTADSIPVEVSSNAWLGHYSVVEEIRTTGLWNIQHSGFRYVRGAMKEAYRVASNPVFAGV
ncbi:MAG: hypothetical protein E5X48_33450 [Mesorhizobium sp.]|nr:DUF6884 domain-containing protein [Mesorhizobium sp.]TIQ26887.1 MAG: hypothetical protein E5X48_33450 [Mesorhizobium sp.]